MSVVPRRFLYSSCFFCNKYSSREARFLTKLIKKNSNKKNSGPPTVTEYVMGLDSSDGSNRRLTVLNKLFMKYVTDLMATGNVSGDLLGKGLEISRVSVTPKYDILQVFWISKNSETDPEIEGLLNNAAHLLHHELTQLRLMGRVPRIKFVKDLLQLRLSVIQELLNKVEVGSSENENEDVECIQNEIEPMPSNVYGLDHERIMNKIKCAMHRRKAVHRKQEMNLLTIPDISSEDNVGQISTKRSDLLSYIQNSHKSK